jgi:hypothetical protein
METMLGRIVWCIATANNSSATTPFVRPWRAQITHEFDNLFTATPLDDAGILDPAGAALCARSDCYPDRRRARQAYVTALRRYVRVLEARMAMYQEAHRC